MPLSIIIVGIGKEDFGEMNDLDADTAPLCDDHGEFSKRDIVQFVPFDTFKNDPVLLAKEVLREVPKQMTSYF